MSYPEFVIDINQMNKFDNKAHEWDKESIHWERSKVIAEKILKIIPVKTKTKALEYGAGTGILSFLLSDFFTEIMLMDSSPEMIKVIQEKIVANKSTNMRPLLFNLEQSEYCSDSYDCVFTQMALHHISNVEIVLNRFFQILNSGGYLIIADLYPEDGSFHGEGFTGHKGFDVERLKRCLEKIGFTNVLSEQCFIMKKATHNVLRDYPVFLLVAEKS